MGADLDPVFRDLAAVLRAHARRLATVRDTADELYLDTRHVQKNGKPLFFGAVRRGKAYVSLHLFPVYVKPELLQSLSPALRARMHGKSCFNFNAVDKPLLAEVAALVKAGYASFEQQGLV